MNQKGNMTMIMIAVIAVVAVVGFFLMRGMNNNDTLSGDTTVNTGAMEKKRGEEGMMVGGALMTPDKDIVDNAVNSKDHTTVVAAVQAAGLVETLKSAGPFTVFAPTNAAFEKLPAGTVETLVKPESKTQLTSILTYHLVPGAYRSTNLTNGMKLKTVQGQELTFTEKDGGWWINGTSKVEIADVISSNGVTHVIDTVLMPM